MCYKKKLHKCNTKLMMKHPLLRAYMSLQILLKHSSISTDYALRFVYNYNECL